MRKGEEGLQHHGRQAHGVLDGGRQDVVHELVLQAQQAWGHDVLEH
jgi:hypothetical protein